MAPGTGNRLAELLLSCLMVAVVSGVSRADPARAPESEAAGEPRPAPSALRLGDQELLARFTPEVRRTPVLRERALALWRLHFQSSADELLARLEREDDWRPVLADAATLVEEFLEASLLPRMGQWPVEGAEEDKVWVEKLDRRTGLRVRVQKAAPRSADLFAPKK